MTPAELRASFGLAAIFGLRMVGMFIILPVFALYAEQLRGGRDHTLIGLALGAYGLTQALLQIPVGAVSDRWGRKRTIYLGLTLFAAGSFVAAFAQDIYMVIVGRVIQGSGAISAAVIALAADLTRDEQRTKSMAIIGVTIGAAFGLSIVAGPLLTHVLGVPGVFGLTGVLALAAMGVVRWVVPNAAHAIATSSRAQPLLRLLHAGGLARLNFGIFVLHAVLMALFVVVPFQLRSAGLAAGSHWKVYLAVMVGSILLMLPLMVLAERRGWQKLVFVAAVGVLFTGQLGLAACSATVLGITGSLLVFFAGLNLLEAMLPSLVSRAAPAGSKGAAVGIYSSIQFLGSFAGAALGGAISQHLGPLWVFGACAALTLVWIGVAAGMEGPQPTGTRTYPIPPLDAKRAAGLSRKLAGVTGVREALVMAGEGVAYLTVEPARFDEQNVLELIAGET
ncbi:MAG TPA: MFS transporter [Burkholderiales bacterium]|nr:MFS transporter [Burkholderiales bacterium]